MIVFDAVTKQYRADKPPVVKELSFTIAQGELVALLGESGSGKTTMLKMINRLIEPTSGRVLIDGKDIAQTDLVTLRRGIGYVIQGSGLFPHLTVAENIAVVPRLLGWPAARIARRVEELLALVKLDPGRRDCRPAELSGGQQQRVGFARALAAEPRIMLLDEPFGALDPLIRTEVRDDFLEWQKRLGLTAVMVTHDMVEALVAADRIAVLKDGHLISGTPRELIANPREPFVRELLETPARQRAQLDALWAGGIP